MWAYFWELAPQLSIITYLPPSPPDCPNHLFLLRPLQGCLTSKQCSVSGLNRAIDVFFFMDATQTFYFPSFQFVRWNSNEAQGGGCFRCSRHTILVANCTLVSTASPTTGPVSYPFPAVSWAPACKVFIIGSPLTERCLLTTSLFNISESFSYFKTACLWFLCLINYSLPAFSWSWRPAVERSSWNLHLFLLS